MIWEKEPLERVYRERVIQGHTWAPLGLEQGGLWGQFSLHNHGMLWAPGAVFSAGPYTSHLWLLKSHLLSTAEERGSGALWLKVTLGHGTAWVWVLISCPLLICDFGQIISGSRFPHLWNGAIRTPTSYELLKHWDNTTLDTLNFHKQ